MRPSNFESSTSTGSSRTFFNNKAAAAAAVEVVAVDTAGIASLVSTVDVDD